MGKLDKIAAEVAKIRLENAKLRAALKNAEETAAVYAANNSALMIAQDEARKAINMGLSIHAIVSRRKAFEAAAAAWLEKYPRPKNRGRT